MAGFHHELGKLYRSMGVGDTERVDPANRMRALSGLARLLRAAEEARDLRRAYRSDRPAAEIPTHDRLTEDRSNVVPLIVPART